MHGADAAIAECAEVKLSLPQQLVSSCTQVLRDVLLHELQELRQP